MDVDLPSAGAIAYPEPMTLIIDDKLPAGLVIRNYEATNEAGFSTV